MTTPYPNNFTVKDSEKGEICSVSVDELRNQLSSSEKSNSNKKDEKKG